MEDKVHPVLVEAGRRYTAANGNGRFRDAIEIADPVERIGTRALNDAFNRACSARNEIISHGRHMARYQEAFDDAINELETVMRLFPDIGIGPQPPSILDHVGQNEAGC